MPEAVSSTSPVLSLYRAGVLGWLPRLFDEVSIPGAVVRELAEGQQAGHYVPVPADFAWLRVIEPHAVPARWRHAQVGEGERAAVAAALESPGRIVLLDDSMARRLAQEAGLEVWGTLRVLLEARARGLTEAINPLLERLKASGTWVPDSIRKRVLELAGEGERS